MFTSCGGRAITRAGSAPANTSTTLSEPSARRGRLVGDRSLHLPRSGPGPCRLTWTTIVTRLDPCAASRLRPANALRVDARTPHHAVRSHASAVICGAIGASRQENRVDRFVPFVSDEGRVPTCSKAEAGCCELHAGGDRGVEAPPLEILRHLGDETVGCTPQLQIGIAVGFA